MKQTLVAIGLCLLLAACGGGDEKSTDTSRSETAATTSEPDSDEAAGKKNVIHQMPDSDQIEDAYDAILEKADIDDPELLEVYVNFSRSMADDVRRGDAHMSLQMVSPQDKNKIVSYRYTFDDEQVEGPVEVTLTSGIGASEKFIDTYDGFKPALFRKSDIMDFDKADEVYEQAIVKSGYDPKDCYVHQLSFKYRATSGELNGDVSVQSTRSTTAHKSFAVDKSGNVQ